MITIKPTVLILASRYDLSCDYVIARLRNLDCSYLRINSEDLPFLDVNLDPINATLSVYAEDKEFVLDNNLKAVYYRRPVFLRENNNSRRDIAEQFQRHQWASFYRNLMIFDKSYWVNHPSATYYAEHKAIQLHQAHQVGFDIPHTAIGNNLSIIKSVSMEKEKIVIKGVDTVLIRQGDFETFGYTKIVDVKSLPNEDVKSAPLIFQELLSPKIDLRVTVIGSQVFTAAVSLNNDNIHGDWREQKEKVSFNPFDLPGMIQQKCVQLLKQLGLVYGAIDLAIANEKYYFLEINPTGEWAWLVNSAMLPIDVALAETLVYQN